MTKIAKWLERSGFALAGAQRSGIREVSDLSELHHVQGDDQPPTPVMSELSG